jgi:methyl-accepting chemotaxis protein
MRNLKIRIGTKLGLSALAGLMLVAGMVGNQARVNRLTSDLMQQASVSRQLQQAAYEARAVLNELISIDRSIRLARTAADVNSVLQHLKSRTVEANAAYDGALAFAAREEDRQLLDWAKKAFNDFVATAEEVAAIQYEIIDLRDRQLAETHDWTKKFDDMINGPAIATAANRYALENNLQQARSEFMQASTISWSRFVRSDVKQIVRLADALSTALLLLDESRSMTRDPQAQAAVDGLSAIPLRYKVIVDAQTAAVQKQTDLMLQRGESQRAEASDTLGLMAVTADQRADALGTLTLQESAHAEWINLIVGVLVILVMFGVAIVSSVTIGWPIRKIAEVLKQLASGENEVEIPFQRRQDEVGDAARAASIFRDNIIRMRDLEAEQKRTVGETARARREQTRKLADEFEQAVGAIVEAVSVATGELHGTAKSLSETAHETHQLANSVSTVASDASSNVRSVAVASDQLAMSIAEIGEQAQRSRDITNEAVRSAASTDARIAQMSEVAARIDNVLDLITGIAHQTNLLALNATIEAARSGEAGRGFAVVASEVKNLANQTAKATEEIARQIEDIQIVTRDSIASIKDIGSIIQRVSEIATKITSAVEEQHAATREIAHNVQEAAQGTDSVTAKIKKLEADASKTGSAASQVFMFASQLATEGGTLKRQVESFLQTVRSAS